MANFTKDEHQTTTQEYLCTTGLGIHQKIFLITINIPLSIMTFLGNVLIIVALSKVSSLHPPSKLLLGCLASTDLSVGLVTRPLRRSLFMSPEHSKRCYYINLLYESIGGMFCAVSVLTLTAISVDRLLALMLGLRYRQVVTLKRIWVFAVTSWLLSAGHHLHSTVILYSNINCLLHENLSYTSPSSYSSARSGSPRTTEWRKNSSEYSKIQKNRV